MNNQRFTLFFVMLILCTSFMVCIAQLGPKLVATVFPSELIYEEGTQIGSINISGMTKEEASTTLTTSIDEWRETAEVALRVQDQTYEYPLEEVQFLVDASFDPKNGGSNPIPVAVEKTAVVQWLEATLPKEIADLVDAEMVQFKLEDIASFLVSEPTLIRAEEVLTASAMTDNDAIVEQVRLLPNQKDDLAAIEGMSLTLEPASNFSFLQQMKEDGVTSLSEEQQEILASLTYEVMLQSPFVVKERNVAQVEPVHVPVGFDVDLSETLGKDFIVYNPTESPYTIEFHAIPGGITAVLKGLPFLYTYEVDIRDTKEFKPKVIKQFDPLLASGEVKVKEEGVPGKLVTVYQTTLNEGSVVEEKVVAEDFYPPIHRVELQSIVTEEPTTPGEDDTERSEDVSDVEETDDSSEVEQDDASSERTTTTREEGKEEGKEEGEDTAISGNGTEAARKEEDSIWEQPQGNDK